MIVLDASAVVDLLLGLPPHDATVAGLLARNPQVSAPHLLDVEVAQVIRRRVLARMVRPVDAAAALQVLTTLPIVRYAHLPFIERAFELRENATVYDAVYLVLAEALGATLVTRDKALAAVPGVKVHVKVLA